MKRNFLFVLNIFLIAIPTFAQDTASDETPAEPPPNSGDFWICPGFETAMYSRSGVSYGGSLALGYGKGASLGLKAVFFVSPDNTTLEINFLLRMYLQGALAYSGPFLQLAGGPVLFAEEGIANFPTRLGSISGGLSFGWRFLFKDRWFIEPAIRAGYPYIAGANISGGVRF